MQRTTQAFLLRPSNPVPGAPPETVVTADTVMLNDPQNVFKKVDRDGVDHINIDLRGKTLLGQQLTQMYDLGFIHPEYGQFRSVEGFVGFIRSGAREDRFRWMVGMEARYHSRKLETSFIPGFREIVTEANYFKIVQSESLLKAFTESTLPFDHYYLFETNGRPIQPAAASWLLPAMENLRTLICDGVAFPRADYTGVEDLGRAVADSSAPQGTHN